MNIYTTLLALVLAVGFSSAFATNHTPGMPDRAAFSPKLEGDNEKPIDKVKEQRCEKKSAMGCSPDTLAPTDSNGTDADKDAKDGGGAGTVGTQADNGDDYDSGGESNKVVW